MWIDGQRPIFTVNFQLMSTVVTTDQHLHNLFAHTDRMLERATSPPPSETEICKILKVWGYIWYLETLGEAGASRIHEVYPSIVLISSLTDCILLFYFCEEYATPVQSLCVCVLNLLDVKSEVLLSLVFVSLGIQKLFVHTVYSLEWDLHLMLLLNGRR
jgi:hypothetical protein